MFAELNKTVGDTTVLSDEAKKSINDSSDAGVQEINYTQDKEQVWTFKSYFHHKWHWEVKIDNNITVILCGRAHGREGDGMGVLHKAL